jgi:dephospho-CoA kinase
VSTVIKPLRIGLTGGIASGKSTVAGVLQDCGAWVVDTDAISRQLTQPHGLAIPQIRAEFGDAFIDRAGALDRLRMRDLVFSNLTAKARLEAVLHPLITDQALIQANAAPQGTLAVVFDIPLLVETQHWLNRVGRVLVVDCSEATQRQRLLTRPGWTVPLAQKVIRQQATREERCACADAVILNEGLSMPELALQVQAIWFEWVSNPA